MGSVQILIVIKVYVSWLRPLTTSILITGGFQTLFRLPLRSRVEASRSPISNTPILTYEVYKLVDEYRLTASSSLLFIPVQSISMSFRGTRESVKNTWGVRASRQTQPPDSCGHIRHQVTISSTHSLTPEEWCIVSKQATIDSLPTEHVPLIKTHRIRNISVGVAARVDREKSGALVFIPRLYSKLPLPTETSLPIHVEGSFILADDRRSIRFEDSGSLNPESRYNLWILNSKVPYLYHTLLESWPIDNSLGLWPRIPKSLGDSISRTVANAFFECLPSSSRRLIVTPDGHRRSPADTVFLSEAQAKGVRKVAKRLAQSDVAIIPNHIWVQLQGLRSGSIHFGDADYFISLLRREMSSFESAVVSGEFTIPYINDLLSLFQHRTEPGSLVGLPLLPLATSTLAHVAGSSPSPFYFIMPSCSKTWRPWPLFSPARFLHPDLDVTVFTTSFKFNVVPFSKSEIIPLITATIQPSPSRHLNSTEQQWLRHFWEDFDELDKLSVDDISTLPVIPTVFGGPHVSLQECRSALVLKYPLLVTSQMWLPQMLVRLGARVVKISECSRMLQSVLHFLDWNFKSIVEFLATLPQADLPTRITQFSEDHQEKFASYIRNQLFTLRDAHIYGKRRNRKTVYTVNHQATLRHLPIWKASNGSTQSFFAVSSNQFKMLPRSLRLSALRPFLRRETWLTEYSQDLVDILDVRPLGVCALINKHLDLPGALTANQIGPFQNFLRDILATDSGVLTLPVPNTLRDMVSCNTLYAHSVPLFRTVFQHSPDVFLLPSMRSEFESLLEKSGLKRIIDFSAFLECAKSVHRMSDEEGAAAAAEWYNNHLWTVIKANRNQWLQLDELQFIPRSDVRRNYQEPAFLPDEYAHPLPAIIQPKKLLRAEHEAIAWTQRALFRDPPSFQLLMAHPTLGVPEGCEVVCLFHERCLTAILKSLLGRTPSRSRGHCKGTPLRSQCLVGLDCDVPLAILEYSQMPKPFVSFST